MVIIRDLFLFDMRFRIGFIILICLFLLVGLSFCSPYEQTARRVVPRNRTPSSKHWLGTNSLGQDIFWQLTFAVRNSLLIGLISTAVSRIIAVMNGMVSGYLGGPVDRVLSTITDSFVVIPRLPLLILVSFVFRGGLNIITTALLLGFLDWAWPSSATGPKSQPAGKGVYQYRCLLRDEYSEGHWKTAFPLPDILPSCRLNQRFLMGPGNGNHPVGPWFIQSDYTYNWDHDLLGQLLPSDASGHLVVAGPAGDCLYPGNPLLLPIICQHQPVP